MHLAGLLWMRNKGSKMADLSHGLVEEDLTSSEGPSHVLTLLFTIDAIHSSVALSIFPLRISQKRCKLDETDSGMLTVMGH